jgi:hypothetical protein
MPNTINYVTKFLPQILEMYRVGLKSMALFESNKAIQITGAKDIKIPVLTTSGLKDHNRSSMDYNSGNYSDNFITKQLDHDRDVEFFIDPMDVDETNLILKLANITSTFEKDHAIPELDCYTFSKLFSVAPEGTKINTVPTEENILDLLDADIEAMSEAGVPLERVKLYITPAMNRVLKNAQGITRTINLQNNSGVIDRKVRRIDDIQEIIEVPSTRLKTLYDFTDGCVASDTAKQINYILVDPECQVSRVKHAYMQSFAPNSDSRVKDKYAYDYRRYNGTFGLDGKIEHGLRINVEA